CRTDRDDGIDVHGPDRSRATAAARCGLVPLPGRIQKIEKSLNRTRRENRRAGDDVNKTDFSKPKQFHRARRDENVIAPDPKLINPFQSAPRRSLGADRLLNERVVYALIR